MRHLMIPQMGVLRQGSSELEHFHPVQDFLVKGLRYPTAKALNQKPSIALMISLRLRQGRAVFA